MGEPYLESELARSAMQFTSFFCHGPLYLPCYMVCTVRDGTILPIAIDLIAIDLITEPVDTERPLTTEVDVATMAYMAGMFDVATTAHGRHGIHGRLP